MESKTLLYVFLIFSGTIMTLSFLSEPSITGHAFVNTYVKDVNVTLAENTSYMLEFGQDEVELNGVSLTGKIIGEGSVNIYIENGAEKHLVYSTQNTRKGLSSITGFMAKDVHSNFVELDENKLPDFEEKKVQQHKDNLDVLFEDEQKRQVIFDSVVDPRTIKEFKNSCADTCILEHFKGNEFNFEFELSGNLLLKIDKITYRMK